MRTVTVILTIVLILVCIFSGATWLTARQDLRDTQATADYYYKVLISANAEIKDLNFAKGKLEDKLRIASETVTKLNKEIGELESTNDKLKVRANLGFFKDTDELEDFLAESDADHRIYLFPGKFPCDGYDSEDYAFALLNHAFAKGFYMNIQVVWNYRRPDTGELITTSHEGYALNSTIIGNILYFIEPMTDDHWIATYLD